MQEVYLDKFIRLLDAPGIVPGPNSEVGTILRNCVQVQKLADPVTPVETILQRCNLEEVHSRSPGGCPTLSTPRTLFFFLMTYLLSFLNQISNYYGVSGFQTTEHFLTAVAHRLGKKKKGGLYSQEQAAKAVLADWVR